MGSSVMMSRRPMAWVPLISAMAVSAALTAVIGWRLNLQSIREQINAKRAALKKLVLSGSIPPNQEVMDYFTSRMAALEERSRYWVSNVTVPPLAEAAKTDPQLYFQERFHDIQRNIERLAAARKMMVPEQLGFPKELPPSDTVPRLLAQLTLIQDAATLIFDAGVAKVSSFKVEDPASIPEAEGGETFLVQLPVQVRLTSALSQLMQVLPAIQRAEPFMDVRQLRVERTADGDQLNVELVLCRYLIAAHPQATDQNESNDASGASSTKPRGRSQPSVAHRERRERP